MTERLWKPYEAAAAGRRYAARHERSLGRRVAARREVRLALGLLRQLRASPPLLDVPAGTGRLFPCLAPLGPVVAVEPAPGMLAWARAAAPPGVRLVRAALPALPFPDAAFGGVVCLRLLHHLREPETLSAFLGELARVAAGPVVASLFLAGNWQSWRRQRKARRLGPRARQVWARPELEEAAARAGLALAARRPLCPGLSALTVVGFRPA